MFFLCLMQFTKEVRRFVRRQIGSCQNMSGKQNRDNGDKSIIFVDAKSLQNIRIQCVLKQQITNSIAATREPEVPVALQEEVCDSQWEA